MPSRLGYWLLYSYRALEAICSSNLAKGGTKLATLPSVFLAVGSSHGTRCPCCCEQTCHGCTIRPPQ
jgi:hypothetical protein